MTRLLAVALLAACHVRAVDTGAAPPPAPPIATIAPERCAAELREHYAIDVAPEPRVCVPLFEALASLPQAQPLARGMTIVHDARGFCGDACPDLASAVYSDAQQASYSIARHSLHVTDALFDGPRWRGAAPTHAQVSEYLMLLGLDWNSFVVRVRALATLPPGELPEGDVRVLDALVRVAPRVMMGGDVSLADMFRHELGHMIQFRGQPYDDLRSWSVLTGWLGRSGDPATTGAPYVPEQAIVGSRLLLGLPRGDGEYRATRTGQPTLYAQFDPWEDFAESTRLAYRDPRALSHASAIRLFLAGDPATLRDPAVRSLIVPTLAILLGFDGCSLALAAVRNLGGSLLPEAAPLADATPLPVPADALPRELETLAKAQCTATVGGLVFRPTDAAFGAWFAAMRTSLGERESICAYPCE